MSEIGGGYARRQGWGAASLTDRQGSTGRHGPEEGQVPVGLGSATRQASTTVDPQSGLTVDRFRAAGLARRRLAPGVGLRHGTLQIANRLGREGRAAGLQARRAIARFEAPALASFARSRAWRKWPDSARAAQLDGSGPVRRSGPARRKWPGSTRAAWPGGSGAGSAEAARFDGVDRLSESGPTQRKRAGSTDAARFDGADRLDESGPTQRKWLGLAGAARLGGSGPAGAARLGGSGPAWRARRGGMSPGGQRGCGREGPGTLRVAVGGGRVLWWMGLGDWDYSGG